jgi:hypothetical protein
LHWRGWLLLGGLAWTMASPAAGPGGPGGALQGEYRFHGKTLIDPPPGEPADTHLGLVLEGPAARELYRRLKTPSVRDLCLDDGSRSKTQGALRCTELAAGKGWRCEFGIQLDSPRLVAVGVC